MVSAHFETVNNCVYKENDRPPYAEIDHINLIHVKSDIMTLANLIPNDTKCANCSK